MTPSEPLDLLTLRLVALVAESGSISAGSDRMHLAVAAASVRISALEAALGVRIFERSPRGVTLTPAGRLLVQRGQDLLSGADQLVNDLRDWSIGLAGHVRLLANASAIIEVLPCRLAAFTSAHPRIRVDVEECMSPETLLVIREGRADVGIVDLPTPSNEFEFTPCFRDTLAVILASEHPLAGAAALRLDDLLDQDFITLAGTNAVAMRIFNAASALGRQVKVALKASSFDAATRMAAAGLGVTVLPRESVGPQLAHLPLRVVPLQESWADRTHHLVTRRGDEVPAAARTLVAALAMPNQQPG